MAIGATQLLKGQYAVRPVTFLIPATSKTLVENVFETTFSFDLNGVEAPCDVEAYIKMIPKTGKEVVGYRIIKSDAESSTGQTQTPQKQVAAERAGSQASDNFDLDRKAHDKKLGLAGIVQAMIARGALDSEITGNPNEMSTHRTAKEWVQWVADESKKMAIAETFAPDAPHLHTPSVTIETVNEAFGPSS